MAILTESNFEEIKSYLENQAKKDSTFTQVSSIDDTDVLMVLKEDKNRKITLSDFVTLMQSKLSIINQTVTNNYNSTKWYTGVGVSHSSADGASIMTTPDNISHLVGDMYLNTTLKNIYQCTVGGLESMWTYVCTLAITVDTSTDDTDYVDGDSTGIDVTTIKISPSQVVFSDGTTLSDYINSQKSSSSNNNNSDAATTVSGTIEVFDISGNAKYAVFNDSGLLTSVTSTATD